MPCCPRGASFALSAHCSILVMPVVHVLLVVHQCQKNDLAEFGFKTIFPLHLQTFHSKYMTLMRCLIKCWSQNQFQPNHSFECYSTILVLCRKRHLTVGDGLHYIMLLGTTKFKWSSCFCLMVHLLMPKIARQANRMLLTLQDFIPWLQLAKLSRFSTCCVCAGCNAASFGSMHKSYSID